MILLVTAAFATEQDVAWQTQRALCEQGDAVACAARGDELTPWNAVQLQARCADEPKACEVLAEAGWTLPFRRLAADDEPVYAGLAEVLDGGVVLVSPSGGPASVWDPSNGQHVATFHHRIGGVEAQETFTAEADGVRAELVAGQLTIWQDEQQLAQLHGAFPMTPMLIDRGRVVLGGRLVFDVDPQEIDVTASADWIAGEIEKQTPPPRPELPAVDPVVDAEHCDGLDEALRGKVRLYGRPVEGARVSTGSFEPALTDHRGRFCLPVVMMEGLPVSLWAETDSAVSPVVRVVAGEKPRLDLVDKGDPSVVRIEARGGAREPLDAWVRVGGLERRTRDGAAWYARSEDEPVHAYVRYGGQRFDAQVAPEQVRLVASFDTASFEAHVPAGEMQRLRLVRPDGRAAGLGSDASGRVALADLPAGEHELWWNDGDGVQVWRFELEPGEQLTAEAAFDGAPRIVGRLVDADGQPWIGVKLEARVPQFGDVVVHTDLDGAFVVDGLPPGEHTFRLAQKTRGGWRHLDELTVAQDDLDVGDVVR